MAAEHHRGIHMPKSGAWQMAKIFKRIKNLISSNIDDMIDKIEDPDRIIKMSMREMEDRIMRAKEAVANAAACENELAKNLADYRKRAGDSRKQAESALESGKENDARTALATAKSHEKMAADISAALSEAEKTTGRLKTALVDLENELERTRMKHGMLAARQQAAEARQYLDETMGRLRGEDSREQFDRFEDRVLDAESRAEATESVQGDISDLEREIDRMTVDAELEADLDSLRKKIQLK